MRVYNFKINKNFVVKGFLLICIIICIAILIYAGSKLFTTMNNNSKEEENFVVNDSYFADNESFEIPSNQYTNVLKEVHDNLDEYIGKTISFTGYIYRIDYLGENQFVLARNMIINSASQTVIVGFLSEYENINNFASLSWVKVTGTIEKGELNGEIPLLRITQMEETTKPEDEFVYPPDDTYVQTSASMY